MNAQDAWREVVTRQISIVPAFDGYVWMATVDEKGTGIASKNRKVRMISATSSTPIGAVEALIEKLKVEAEEHMTAAAGRQEAAL